MRTTAALIPSLGYFTREGLAGQAHGDLDYVEKMPSPARAERNQRRKLAFIPVWPLVGAIALVIMLVIVVR